MQRMSHVWSLSHLTLTTRLRLYMSLVVPVLWYASETWTTTSSDLARLQALHIRCQGRILGVHWYERVTNIVVSRRTNFPHIGSLLASRKYFLFGHVVRQFLDVPRNMALKMCRDMSTSRRIPPTWKHPRGRPHSSWTAQLKSNTGVPVGSSWKRASDRDVWKAGATALRNYVVLWVSEITRIKLFSWFAWPWIAMLHLYESFECLQYVIKSQSSNETDVETSVSLPNHSCDRSIYMDMNQARVSREKRSNDGHLNVGLPPTQLPQLNNAVDCHESEKCDNGTITENSDGSNSCAITQLKIKCETQTIKELPETHSSPTYTSEVFLTSQESSFSLLCSWSDC